MVNMQDSRSRGLGLRPGLGHCVAFTVPFSTQEYKWVRADCQEGLIKFLGVTLQWSGIPSRVEQ